VLGGLGSRRKHAKQGSDKGDLLQESLVTLVALLLHLSLRLEDALLDLCSQIANKLQGERKMESQDRSGRMENCKSRPHLFALFDFLCCIGDDIGQLGGVLSRHWR